VGRRYAHDSGGRHRYLRITSLICAYMPTRTLNSALVPYLLRIMTYRGPRPAFGVCAGDPLFRRCRTVVRCGRLPADI